MGHQPSRGTEIIHEAEEKSREREGLESSEEMQQGVVPRQGKKVF